MVVNEKVLCIIKSVNLNFGYLTLKPCTLNNFSGVQNSHMYLSFLCFVFESNSLSLFNTGVTKGGY